MNQHEFVIVAPRKNFFNKTFNQICVDEKLHSSILSGIEDLRDRALRETTGAAEHSAAVTRHLRGLDAESWHVVLKDQEDKLIGCARYRQIKGGFEEFKASESALARSLRYGPVLKNQFERLLAAVRYRGKDYGEAGGWALRPEARCTTAGVNIALMSYALAERLGSGLAVTTATRLNHSASILRRIGARRLMGLPGYYEPKFASVMEIVHFDIPCLNALYASKLKSLRESLRNMRIVCAAPPTLSSNYAT